MELAGKTAIVTGASKGIGRATALALAQAGAGVVINYSNSHAAAEEVKLTIENFGGRALTVKANVADYSQCEDLMQKTLHHFGNINVLVNNAGITRDTLLVRMKPEDWYDVINVNLNGVYNCCRAAIKPFLKQKSGGRIINIASVAGIYGNSGQTNYAASKGGVIAFTRSLAKELGSRNITVNAIAPGFIETEMTANLGKVVKAEGLTRIALGRLGQPEDIAEVVLFLASKAAYVTGQVISVDGGLVL